MNAIFMGCVGKERSLNVSQPILNAYGLTIIGMIGMGMVECYDFMMKMPGWHKWMMDGGMIGDGFGAL